MQRWVGVENAFAQLDRMSAHICEDVGYVFMLHDNLSENDHWF